MIVIKSKVYKFWIFKLFKFQVSKFESFNFEEFSKLCERKIEVNYENDNSLHNMVSIKKLLDDLTARPLYNKTELWK